jgi:hypothetical protein
MPGVGVGIGFARVVMKVGLGEAVGEADGEAVGDEVGDGDALGVELGVGIGVGITAGARPPLDFFLTQTNLPDLTRHSKSAPLLLAARPAFLQLAPLFTAPCDGATAIKEVENPAMTIQQRKVLALSLRRTFTVASTLDMLPSCPTVSQ